MSRSKHSVELCALLVDEIYGELTSRIFTILLRRGRSPIPLLSKHTRLTPRQLRHGLAVLLQQNLIYHNLDEDTGLTHYEANEDAAYMLVRSGKIMEAVASRYGSVAGDIVRNLLLLGQVTVRDLEKAYMTQHAEPDGITNGATQTNGINGDSESHFVHAEGYLHTDIARLLDLGIVEIVKEHMFLSPNDTYNKIEKEMLQLYFNGSTKGTKQKEDLKGKIQTRLRSLRSENQEWQSNGKKRFVNGGHTNGNSNGLNGNKKRRRLSNDDDTVNGSSYPADDGTRLDPSLVVRMNYEKCTVLLRNQRLIVLANERIGKTTSVIYEYALRLVEKKISRCRLDPMVDDVTDIIDGPTFTTLQLTRELPDGFDPRLGIGKGDVDANALEKSLRSKPKHDEAEVEGEASADEDEDDDHHMNGNGNGNIRKLEGSLGATMDEPFDEDNDPRPAKKPKVTFQDKLPKPTKSEPPRETGDMMMHVRNHLTLLAADQCKFVRKCGSTGSGEWTIDFEEMIDYVRNSELDTMILDNFGVHGHRLARMLRKLGKLDEKTLPNIALMRQKDVRTKLAEMQMAGIVDIQEVPRDANRTTGRTMFFWFFDTDRVATIFLENLYKKMSRVFQRLDVERRKYSDILSITERSDVRDLPPEDYLVSDQLKQLGEWKAKEQRLLSQIQRLDELVGVFRDY